MASRPAAWADTLLSQVITAGTPLTALDLLAPLAASDTITVVRLLGRIRVVTAIDVNESGVARVDLGVGVAAAEAFTAGVTPDPGVAGDVPARGWLWRDSVCVATSNSATFGTEVSIWPEVRFDIRSARLVDRGNLYLAADNAVMDGSAMIVRLVGLIRALCLT